MKYLILFILVSCGKNQSANESSSSYPPLTLPEASKKQQLAETLEIKEGEEHFIDLKQGDKVTLRIIQHIETPQFETYNTHPVISWSECHGKSHDRTCNDYSVKGSVQYKKSIDSLTAKKEIKSIEDLNLKLLIGEYRFQQYDFPEEGSFELVIDQKLIKYGNRIKLALPAPQKPSIEKVGFIKVLSRPSDKGAFRYGTHSEYKRSQPIYSYTVNYQIERAE